MSMSKAAKVHIAIPMGAPGGPTSLFQDPPMWCGRTGDYKTPFTRNAAKGTCSRCKRLANQYQEDQEYQRTMQRRAREQEQAQAVG
jgi:hypothetical protein